jgi:hypothetical protein
MDYSPSCSAPAGGGKSTTFTCNVDASQLPDGPVTICVISATRRCRTTRARQTSPGPRCRRTTPTRSATPSLSTGACRRRPAAGTPDPGTPDTDTPNPGAPAPGESAGIPGGLQIGSLSILVPRKVKIGKTKQLVIGAHASQAGQLSLRLVRGKKVVSRLSVGLSAGQTKQRLRLPRRLRAGTYTVKIAFKAIGTSWAATGATKVSARR